MKIHMKVDKGRLTKINIAGLLMAASAIIGGCATQNTGSMKPLMIEQQGSKDHWRSGLEMAKIWAAAINKHGGSATVVHLPEIGIKGNTHFPFSDLNNVEIADLLSKWLAEKELDR